MEQHPTAGPELDEHPVLAGVLVASDGLDKACRSETWQLGDDQIETALAVVYAVESRTAALRAALLGEAEARGLRHRTQSLTGQAWLRDRFRLSTTTGSAQLHAAAGLARQPVIAAALADAAFTVEQSAVAVRIMDEIDRLDQVSERDRQTAAEFLVEHGAVLPPRRLSELGQALYEALAVAPSVDDPADEAAALRDQEAAEAAARRAETNTMRVRRRPDGRARGSFDLSPLGAAALVAWLVQADKRHPGTDGFEDTRPRDQRRGDALVDALLTHLGATGQHPGDGSDQGTGCSDEDDRSASAEVDGFVDARGAFQYADDTADNADGVADAPQLPGMDVPAAAPAPPPARIGVTISLDALRAGLAGAGVLDTGGTLSAAELRRLACDAAIIPIVLGGPAQILDVGRATRTWNPAQERGIYARDRACIAPGCDRPPATCQIHHRWTWADGGPTDIKNGALLCLFHHQQVHRQGWTVTLAANGYPQLIPPASIDPERRPRQHHRFRLTQLTGRHRT